MVLNFVEDGQRERVLERDCARRARLDELAVEGLELVMRDRLPTIMRARQLGRRLHRYFEQAKAFAQVYNRKIANDLDFQGISLLK